jgi:hypothetical protein
MMHQAARCIEKQEAQPFGAARKSSAGNASRFSAVGTLCVRMATRSHAALAEKRPHGNTPAASSFFKTSPDQCG